MLFSCPVSVWILFQNASSHSCFTFFWICFGTAQILSTHYKRIFFLNPTLYRCRIFFFNPLFFSFFLRFGFCFFTRVLANVNPVVLTQRTAITQAVSNSYEDSTQLLNFTPNRRSLLGSLHVLHYQLRRN